MPTEQGVVIRRDSSGTWVKTTQSDSCESCTSRGACHVMASGKDMEVAVLNYIGAVVGDRVVLKMETSPLLKATFLVYMFPILLLLLGAGAGEWLARSTGMDSSAPAVLLGFGSLAGGLVLVKIIGRRLSEQDEYRPRIVRIIGKA